MITLTPQGLHCAAGGFHIDPSRSVDHAIITHAHSDHARAGSRQYLCAPTSEGLLRERIGERFRLGTVTVSLHPAGHILGSAQVRIESEAGQVWVVTGDYKRDRDPTCEPFEVVPCDVFVTEATFGLPIYRWPELSAVAREIEEWREQNARRGRNSLLHAYSLGKAQRVLGELLPYSRRTVYVHESVIGISDRYREAGIPLLPYAPIPPEGIRGRGELVIAPPGAGDPAWHRRLGEVETAFASGWMVVQARRSRAAGYSRSFVISDHADWPALVRTVRETGARKVFVMHGENEILARYLRETENLDARPIESLRAEGPPT
jgi:putative mRNA 3-end processing factor